MKYQELETTENDIVYKHIIIDNEDGTFKSFPAENTNPEYNAFLARLEQEKNDVK
jgi:hypothetical protein